MAIASARHMTQLLAVTRVVALLALTAAVVAAVVVHGMKALLFLPAIPVVLLAAMYLGPNLFRERRTVAEQESRGVAPDRARVAASAVEALMTVIFGGSLAAVFVVLAATPQLFSEPMKIDWLAILWSALAVACWAALVMLFVRTFSRKAKH